MYEKNYTLFSAFRDNNSEPRGRLTQVKALVCVLLDLHLSEPISCSIKASGGNSKLDLPDSDSVFGVNSRADSEARIDSNSGADTGVDSGAYFGEFRKWYRF